VTDARASGGFGAPARTLVGYACRVGFLDELKDQARTLQTSTAAADAETLARNRRLANGACQLAHDYWKELCEQLNLIRSPSKARYLIGGRQPVEDLVCSNFRVLPQMQMLPGGASRYETLLLAWQASNGRLERVEKELPKDVERMRATLIQAGIQAHETSVRDPSSGRVLATAFEFQCTVAASVRVTPLPDSGKVRLTFTNIDQLERVEAEYPAAGLRQRLLDEIGRWIVGQPQRVLQYAAGLKRYQH
jgi:hypothetical protein